MKYLLSCFCTLMCLSTYVQASVSDTEQSNTYQSPVFPNIEGSKVKEDTVFRFVDGTYTRQTNNETVVVGRYQLHGDFLVIEDINGELACRDQFKQIAFGIYTWEMDDGLVYITPLEDDCNERRRSFYYTNPFEIVVNP